MKRPHILALSGAALTVVGYFAFPMLFQQLGDASAKQVNVSTAKAAAIRIATSDPKTTLLVSEEDGVVSVIVTKMNADGDYIDGWISVPRDDSNLSLMLSRRRGGIVTVLKESDADGLPMRKSVGTTEGVRSYRRRDIDWIELPRVEDKKPNQSSQPTPPKRRG